MVYVVVSQSVLDKEGICLRSDVGTESGMTMRARGGRRHLWVTRLFVLRDFNVIAVQSKAQCAWLAGWLTGRLVGGSLIVFLQFVSFPLLTIVMHGLHWAVWVQLQRWNLWWRMCISICNIIIRRSLTRMEYHG